jgi:hypothetical protein
MELQAPTRRLAGQVRRAAQAQREELVPVGRMHPTEVAARGTPAGKDILTSEQSQNKAAIKLQSTVRRASSFRTGGEYGQGGYDVGHVRHYPGSERLV